jgi:hypothetical protein
VHDEFSDGEGMEGENGAGDDQDFSDPELHKMELTNDEMKKANSSLFAYNFSEFSREF